MTWRTRMTWDEQRWIGQRLRALIKLGAPPDVLQRWGVWLDAATNLPRTAAEREELAERLDDPEASLPAVVVLN